MYWPTFQKTLFVRMHTFMLVPSKAEWGFPWLPIYNNSTVIVSRDNHFCNRRGLYVSEYCNYYLEPSNQPRNILKSAFSFLSFFSFSVLKV